MPISTDQNDERATACVAGDEISVFYWREVPDSYLSDKKRAGIPQLLSHEAGGQSNGKITPVSQAIPWQGCFQNVRIPSEIRIGENGCRNGSPIQWRVNLLDSLEGFEGGFKCSGKI